MRFLQRVLARKYCGLQIYKEIFKSEKSSCSLKIMTTKINLKKKKQETIHAADFWCGGGGTSTGLALAAQELGLKVELTAVNHWEIAVLTHSTNHPDARHFCKAVDTLSPLDIFPEG